MTKFQLSDDQQKALEPHVRLIEACPGAGKTRTIVERFKRQATSSDKGVALISFTNAAIDEVTIRCGQHSELLKVPHFVGTFDSFIHRYIVTPALTYSLGKAPTYLLSWADLKPEISTFKIGTYETLSLVNFSHDSSGNIVLLEDGLSSVNKRALDRLSTTQRVKVVADCQKRIQRMNELGTYDSDSARWTALTILKSKGGEKILKRLAERFSEVIVDEFQDCATLEHELLNLLHGSEIHVTVVADPDQAIFAFRKAEPQLYDTYKDTISESDVVTLKTNYRSSTEICKFSQNLRNPVYDEMVANPDNQEGVCTSIYLLGGTPEKVRDRFLILADEWKIPLGQRTTLAHRKSNARKLAAGGKAVPNGESKTKFLLENLATLRGSGSAVIRRRSLSSLEKLIAHQFKWSEAQQVLDSSEKLELLGKNRTWVRLIIGELLEASTHWTTTDEVGISIRSILKKHLENLFVPIEGDISRRFTKPSDSLWEYWNDAGAGREETVALGWSTIHASKGHEFDSVLLEVPPEKVMESIVNKVSSEERRVFYVGASRAKKLLVLQVSGGRYSTTKTQLEAMSINLISEKLK